MKHVRTTVALALASGAAVVLSLGGFSSSAQADTSWPPIIEKSDTSWTHVVAVKSDTSWPT
ncbi:hypothetical protein ACIO3S_20840 [Nocardioides sp. NPDC087217]|jgi:hypothetical protein|uniref:hypothetical protein n=1 Tax=Nocardioides sp. NPDC087217 TaxID=3364335 RepID=UPI003823A6B6